MLHDIAATLARSARLLRAEERKSAYENLDSIFDLRCWFREMIDEYFAQLGAYALTHVGLFGTTVTTGVIFMVERDFTYQSFVLTRPQIKIHKCRFLYRLTVYMDKHGEPPLAEGLQAAPGA